MVFDNCYFFFDSIGNSWHQITNTLNRITNYPHTTVRSMELHEKLFFKSLTKQTFVEGEGILFGGRRGTILGFRDGLLMYKLILSINKNSSRCSNST